MLVEMIVSFVILVGGWLSWRYLVRSRSNAVVVTACITVAVTVVVMAAIALGTTLTTCLR